MRQRLPVLLLVAALAGLLLASIEAAAAPVPSAAPAERPSDLPASALTGPSLSPTASAAEEGATGRSGNVGEPPSDPSSSAASDPYSLGFSCPAVSGTNVALPGTCPIYVFDFEDLLSQPVLLVNPTNPSNFVFSSLHGGRGLHGPTDQPPTERSRQSSVHQPDTTYRTTNGGASWQDMPYYPPDSLQAPNREIWGEDNAATLDPAGNLVLAALYSYRDAALLGAVGPAGYAIGVWKERALDQPVDYAENVAVLPSADSGHDSIDAIHLNTAPASGTLVLTAHETGNGTSAKGAVVAYLSAPGGSSSWTRATSVAQPCSEMSNLVSAGSGDLLLFACRTSGGGPLTTWTFDPRTQAFREAATTAVADGHPILVALNPGFALGSASVGHDGKPHAFVSFASSPDTFAAGSDLAPSLSMGPEALSDARFTAATWVPASGNLHVIWMEHLTPQSPASAAASGAAPEFRKALAGIRYGGTYQGKVDLAVGKAAASSNPRLTGIGDGAFSDLHDSIVIWPGARGLKPQEFVAYGDYGFVRFAEVAETNFLPPIPPLFSAAPPIPVASGTTVPVTVGAAAGVLSAAMVARMVMARRKHAVEAPAE